MLELRTGSTVTVIPSDGPAKARGFTLAARGVGSTGAASWHPCFAGVGLAFTVLLVCRKQSLSPTSLANLCWSVAEIGQRLLASCRSRGQPACKALLDGSGFIERHKPSLRPFAQGARRRCRPVAFALAVRFWPPGPATAVDARRGGRARCQQR